MSIPAARTVSLCIPTKNAGPGFAQALELWKAQAAPYALELVVVDSGSSDDTVAQARSAGARALTIPAESFNHGETRNLLARAARGDVLVFTVQDAAPADARVLRELLEPLQDDPSLLGVCGVQVPGPEADLVGQWEATQLGRKAGGEPIRKQLTSWEEFLTWDMERRFRAVSFDNVCSAIRRSAWERTPFARIDFGEDLDWSVRVLRAGGALLMNPAARVVHSPRRPPLTWLARYFIGRRRTNHTLHLPPEFPELDDAAVAGAARGFDAQVQDFLAGGWSRTVVPRLPRIVDWCLPERIRRPLRNLGPVRWVVNWRSGARPLLSLGRLWDEVVDGSGPLAATQVAPVVRRIEALLLGDFLGNYYHTCEVQVRVSARLAELGRWLSCQAGGSGMQEEDELGEFFARLWPA
jgi:rhamnosyltransferase